MARWFTVWVEHPGAPPELLERWPWLRDVLDAEDLKVHGASDGSPHATLRVQAPSEASAIAVARARFEHVFGGDAVAGLETRTVPRGDDPIVFDEEVRDDELRQLWWRRAPCTWSEYATSGDERLVQVHYAQAGGAAGPCAAIAEVVVSEAGATVSISLFERELVGRYPDGAHAGRAL